MWTVIALCHQISTPDVPKISYTHMGMVKGQMLKITKSVLSFLLKVLHANRETKDMKHISGFMF